MFTQNGVSDITSTTRRESRNKYTSKVSRLLRSMRLRVFLIVLLSGTAIAYTFGTVSRLATGNLLIKSKTESVKSNADMLVQRMVANVYTAYPAQMPDISRELDYTAAIYDGRVIAADYNLMILYDSYGTENGKTLISSEAIDALKGISNEYRDKARNTIELTFPIAGKDVLADIAQGGITAENAVKQIQGVLIVSFSTEDCLETTDKVGKRMTLTIIFSMLLLTVAASAAARILTKPFNRINQSLHHASEGFIEDKVDIGGYSEMDRISDSFNEMLGRISKVEESRQEFVSNVSHELKTPLTSMKVLADSLLQQPDAPVELYREFMSDINEEIDRENKIISDLLDLVKLDRKSGDMHIAEIHINEMLDIILKRLRPIAQTAGVEIIFESYREVLAEVDEVKLALAVNNLIENAIKYNRENGKVNVSLNCDHRYFTLVVSDTGIGIPLSELDMIFERFYRVDKMRSRQTGGTGLGLAIARSVVEMHHGVIKAESAEGKGSTFTIMIPLSYIPDTGEKETKI